MGIHNAVNRETISEMPMRRALTVKRGSPVRLAVAQMKARSLGAVIVVDDDHKPLGMFTERLLVRMLARDAAGLSQPIDDHMIPCDALIVRADDPVYKMIHAMQTTGIRFVCVVDADGRVRSLAGFRSLVEWIVEHFPRSVKVQGFEAKLHMDEREGA